MRRSQPVSDPRGWVSGEPSSGWVGEPRPVAWEISWERRVSLGVGRRVGDCCQRLRHELSRRVWLRRHSDIHFTMFEHPELFEQLPAIPEVDDSLVVSVGRDLPRWRRLLRRISDAFSHPRMLKLGEQVSIIECDKWSNN